MPQTDPVAPAVPAEPTTPDPIAPSEPEAEAISDEGLDDHSKKVVEAIRGDFKRERAARQAAEKKATDALAAAEAAQTEMAKKVGKALGLVEDEEVDPAKLIEQATTSQKAAKKAAVELAVFRAAATANADPEALLDSRTFLATVADIEPSDSAALVAAITDAVATNPRLGKAEPVVPGMRPNRAQGTSAQPPVGIDAQIAAAEASGDIRQAIRLKAAKSINSQ